MYNDRTSIHTTQIYRLQIWTDLDKWTLQWFCQKLILTNKYLPLFCDTNLSTWQMSICFQFDYLMKLMHVVLYSAPLNFFHYINVISSRLANANQSISQWESMEIKYFIMAHTFGNVGKIMSSLSWAYETIDKDQSMEVFIIYFPFKLWMFLYFLSMCESTVKLIGGEEE